MSSIQSTRSKFGGSSPHISDRRRYVDSPAAAIELARARLSCECCRKRHGKDALRTKASFRAAGSTVSAARCAFGFCQPLARCPIEYAPQRAGKVSRTPPVYHSERIIPSTRNHLYVDFQQAHQEKLFSRALAEPPLCQSSRKISVGRRSRPQTHPEVQRSQEPCLKK